MSIRAYEPGDRAMIIDLWHRCDLVVSYNDPGKDIDTCIARPQSNILVGLIDDRVVATAMVGDDGHRGWIYYAAVAPELQGGGHGQAIVTAAEDYLRARKVRKVMLMVRETNTKVIGFYDRIGYEDQPRAVMAKWLIPPKE